MNFLFKNINVFKKQVPVIVLLWFAMALVAGIIQVLHHKYNNYLVYEGVFNHTIHQQNLYLAYPAEYFDLNHYGPLFSIVIAPFALLPHWLAIPLWVLFSAAFLLYACLKLPITQKQKLIVVAITALDMMTAAHNLQFNILTAAWLVLSFALVEKEEDFWGTFFIAAGFLIKIYGIAGLLFFLFSRHKVRFILSFIFWMIVLACLPMLISSPHFIIQSYKDWYISLADKNAANLSQSVGGGMQDMGALGMFRRVFGDYNTLYVMAAAALLIVLPLVRFKQYVQREFQLSYLAIVLLTVVLFSSSAESSTYVVAMVGVGIWYLLDRQRNNSIVLTVLIVTLILTSLSPTDLFPKYLWNHYVRTYALKALFPFIIWCWLIADVAIRNFTLSTNKLPQD